MKMPSPAKTKSDATRTPYTQKSVSPDKRLCANVLSIRQPACALVVSGRKDVENRTTRLGGSDWILIASSARPMQRGTARVNHAERQAWLDTYAEPLYALNGKPTPESRLAFPLGAIVGAVRLQDIVPYATATPTSIWAYKDPGDDARPGVCMRFSHALQFKHPIPYKGALGVQQRFPLTQLHSDDMCALQIVTGATTSDALLRLFQRS
jgi:hypothetical protein